MKFLICFSLLFPSLVFAQAEAPTPQTSKGGLAPEEAEARFIFNAKQINVDAIRRLPMEHNGRIKPLDSLAREMVLFITGSYSRFGLSATQIFINLIVDPASSFLPWIEVRSPDLRETLGATKSHRFFSIQELESSRLQELVGPLQDKEQKNKKSLTEYEKKVLETYSQLNAAKMIQTGNSLFIGADLTFNHNPSDKVQDALKAYLSAVAAQNQVAAADAVVNLRKVVLDQQIPDMMTHSLGKLDLEVFYNDSRLFLWACMFYLLLGGLLFSEKFSKKFGGKWVILFYCIPLIFQVSAIAMRVYITRFAPVTNMYGTMIWVSLGVNVFSLVLYALYRNRSVSGLMLIGSGMILLLTEQTPLVLSPDMDPIVAVLRSNYWLSTHVTTITISYAAFTVAMLLGNWALIRSWAKPNDAIWFKEYSHYAYRMIQLGCFLLTVGIILGGIWADYSWGRFWGWDPKETWALIADLGFLAILHSKFVGWVKDFTLLAWAPVAYLLVIMAWYGVNFILGAGLHSYGFSSGGTILVVSFVSAQVLLLAASLLRMKARAA